MKNFKNFELNNSEMIYGGDLISSIWSDGTTTANDLIDTTTGRIVYF